MVLVIFQEVVENNGLLSRVRKDKGRENFNAARFMLINRGFIRAKMIAVFCLHIQRLRRLWIDVKRVEIDCFLTIFYLLQDQETLDLLNEDHFFLAKIHHAIIEFMANWNNYPVNIENNLLIVYWILYQFNSKIVMKVPLKTS